jgi:hypothetical protein
MALKLSDLKEDEYTFVTGKGTKEEAKGGLLKRAYEFDKGTKVGVAKSIGETLLGAGEIGRKIQGGVSKLTGLPMGGESVFDQGSLKNKRVKEILEANAPGEGTGKFIGTTAQYLLPTSGITKAQAGLGALAKTAPTGLQTVSGLLARAVPEAVGTGAVTGLRSGGDMEQMAGDASLAGSFSLALGGLGKLARSSYFPQLDESISKGLGIQGKKSGGVALQETAKRAQGLTVLKNMANQLDVTLDDGTKGKFDPKKASYSTTLQAFNQARSKIYNQYTNLSSKAGESAIADLSDLRTQIASALDAPILSVEKNAVQTLLKDFDSAFPDPSKVDLKVAERFIESLNANTANGIFAGTSDIATGRVYAGTARILRDKMDEVITESTGESYQGLRSQYASLKSLEDDLVRKFQQDARSIGGGLPEYMGAFASADIIGSLLTLDPVKFTKGATLGVFAGLKRMLSNPERFLQRSFDLLDKKEVSDIMIRLFGGVKR